MKISISEEEFLKIIKGLDVCVYHEDEQNKKSYRGDALIRSKKDDINIDDFLYEKWVSGGIAGGSCWDTVEENNHYGIDGESEPEFTDLDTVLLHFAENIPYLKYKTLVPSVIETNSFCHSEYYGNCTNYATKKVVLRKLYNKMIEMDLL